jgi:toxin ParE1/3/4
VTFALLIEQDAEADISEITDWYRDQRNGLEEVFLLRLRESLNELCNNPLQYQQRFRNVRVALLHKFPYQVFYKLFGEKILVLGVIHTSRNPKLIRKRLKK